MASCEVDLVGALLTWAPSFLPLLLHQFHIVASHAGCAGNQDGQEKQRVQGLSKSLKMIYTDE